LYKNYKIAALIFLRENSSRVPKKNLRDFHGQPLYKVILSTLKKSKFIDQIIVNTPSKSIALGCKEIDITVHNRPEWLDKVDSNEANEIIKYDLSLTKYNFFLQTHSTNPLLKIETIDDSIETFFENSNEFDSLFSVTPFQKRFYTNNFSSINHKINNLVPTQQIDPVLMENSCIYIFSRKSFLKNGNRIGNKPFLYKMDYFESVDIDTEQDFQLAEISKKLI
tara:strand:+ start:1288 stop:1956 length:669 start_codon:yes stop_codon:yes gene_type:complete